MGIDQILLRKQEGGKKKNDLRTDDRDVCMAQWSCLRMCGDDEMRGHAPGQLW